ncbi:MAG: bifunctional folylpolyglutamate synthase/dihydrofolate synthase [Intestinimonas sp.]|nr:bifunctional folylpolyglutamate synthase/dihydrofolate synthase [Intestinimonas sp.]
MMKRGALMSGAEAIAYIHSRTWLGSRPGLSRTHALLDGLGHPERGLRFVHIAGTNGKGSTAAMLASVLRTAGYRTGLNSSPYLQTFHERVQINGTMISDADLGELMTEVKAAADRMDDPPTEFELITALAFLYFQRKQCDIVVLEVGLGGLLDSTNVIEAPEAAVITAIGLDHQKQLGSTLEEIASAKAGIIKPDCDVVLYQQPARVERVVEEVCARQSARLHRADFSRLTPLRHNLDGQTFRWDGQELFLPLLGDHQLCNAAAALTTVEVLRRKGWTVRDEDIRAGFAAVKWPARFEVLERQPLFIVDGGHNPQCVQALVRNLQDYLPNRPVTFLTGVLADKDYPAMYRQVAPMAAHFVTVTPLSTRALSAAELAAHLEPYGVPTVSAGTIEEGVEIAKKLAGEDGAVCAFGSLYMAGAVRACFGR